MGNLEDILHVMEKAIDKFNSKVPTIQKGVLDELLVELKGLDLRSKRIANTVKNIRLIAKVKGKLLKIILNDDYKKAIKEYTKVFDEVTKIQNQYFQRQEASASAFRLGKVLKQQTISDTIDRLTEAGIGKNIVSSIQEILRTNITTGSSYKSLQEQLNNLLTQSGGTDGAILKYTKQITTDAVNQYSAQYMQNMTSDLGYEWYRYQGKNIDTSRPFCFAMTEREYFHITEVQDLLAAKDLYYTEDGEKKRVRIYKRTGLPYGMIEDTDESNFFVRRGGYNCGHQIFPVAESRVPQEHKERVYSTPAYRMWKGVRLS